MANQTTFQTGEHASHLTSQTKFRSEFEDILYLEKNRFEWLATLASVTLRQIKQLEKQNHKTPLYLSEIRVLTEISSYLSDDFYDDVVCKINDLEQNTP